MKKVLIVADDKAFLETLVSALEMEDYEGLSFLDEKQGFQLASKEPAKNLFSLDYSRVEVAADARHKA